MYTDVKNTHKKGICYLVRVDVATGKAYGEHGEDFTDYVVLQGKSKVSILLDSWHNIYNDLKDSLRTNIAGVFDVSPDDSKVKKKVLTYAGERLRGLKTQLTHDYITHPTTKSIEKPPYEIYSFIDQDCWKEFIKSHTTAEFLAKSKKGKLNRSINVYPHRLSR
ncbi:unnamed protein product [Lathyrus oleraceus]